MDFHLERVSLGKFKFVVDRPAQPYGFCQCGCGRKTTVSKRNHGPLGWVKGRPLKWVMGHGAFKNLNPLSLEGTCLIWMAGRNDRGYGTIGSSKSKAGHSYIHILMYEKFTGPVESDLELDHLCRNTSCVNPRHLEPVSHAENCRRGSMAKLTHDSVKKIKELWSFGRTQIEIGRQFNVHSSHVSRILSGKRW